MCAVARGLPVGERQGALACRRRCARAFVPPAPPLLLPPSFPPRHTHSHLHFDTLGSGGQGRSQIQQQRRRDRVIIRHTRGVAVALVPAHVAGRGTPCSRRVDGVRFGVIVGRGGGRGGRHGRKRRQLGRAGVLPGGWRRVSLWSTALRRWIRLRSDPGGKGGAQRWRGGRARGQRESRCTSERNASWFVSTNTLFSLFRVRRAATRARSLPSLCACRPLSLEDAVPSSHTPPLKCRPPRRRAPPRRCARRRPPLPRRRPPPLPRPPSSSTATCTTQCGLSWRGCRLLSRHSKRATGRARRPRWRTRRGRRARWPGCTGTTVPWRMR